RGRDRTFSRHRGAGARVKGTCMMVNLPALADAAAALRQAILSPDTPNRRQNAARWLVEGTTSERTPPDPDELVLSAVVRAYVERLLKVLYPSGGYGFGNRPPIPGAEDLPVHKRRLLNQLVEQLTCALGFQHLVQPGPEQDDVLHLLEQAE